MDPVQLLIELGVIPGPSGAGFMPGHATAMMPGALPGVQGDPEPAPPAFPPGGYAPSMSQAPPALGPPNQSSFDRNRGAYPYPVGQGPGSLIPPGAGGAVPTTGGNLAPPGVDGSDPYAMLAQLFEPSMGPQGAEPSRQGGYAPPEGDPSRQGGYGAGAPAQGGQQAPAPSGGTPTQGQPPAAVPGTPTPASPTTSPTGASTGAGQSALSAPDSRNRLFQMLSIMGAVLAQPAPPGGNTMSQVAKALAMGNLYNDSMNRADQERGDVRVKQELDNRRVAAEETQVRQGGQRVGIAQQGANTDQALAAAKIRTMDAELQLMPASVEKARYQAELARIHAMTAGPEAIQKLQLLDSQIQLHKAHTEQVTASVGTPQAREDAKTLELLMKSGAIDATTQKLNPGLARTVLATQRGAGFREANMEEDKWIKDRYAALIKSGRKPDDAEQELNSLLVQKRILPRQFVR